MSETDDDYQDSGYPVVASLGGDDKDVPQNKKRKIQRACDVCRRKKIRCDGPTQASSKCSNCGTNQLECTYIEVAKKRGPPKGYVESLENRLEKMEGLLQKLYPGTDFSSELGPPIERNIWAKDPNAFPARAKATNSSPTFSKDPKRALSITPLPGLGPEIAKSEHSDEETSGPFGNFAISEDLSRLSLTNIARRYYGRSAMFIMIQAAVDRKREYLGMNGSPLDMIDGATSPGSETLLPTSRPEYWAPCQWELAPPRPRQLHELEFPPPDLMETLIEIYFLSNNCHFPLLHRPTFEAQYRADLHLTNKSFAEVLLLVCATASRCTDDQRVLLDPMLPHSAGWKYYEQTNIMDRSLVTNINLFDLQCFVLAAWYLLESSANHAAWTLTGVGLRFAQDVGAHRQRVYSSPMTPDDELWKRAFWCLIVLDRMLSSTLGRAPALYDSDIDVDLPLEVDDEHWIHLDPTRSFKQPPDIPSRPTAFVHLTRLCSILAYAMQTLYAANKSQIRGVNGPMWEQQVLAELDTLINKWITSMPKHLEWEKQMQGDHPVFFTQSTSLYALLYHIQILIHHPFVSTPKRPNPGTSFPSQQICVNAARSCAHVVDAYRKRSRYFAPWCVVGAITSAIVLLQSVWGASGAQGTQIDLQETMNDVDKCMQVIMLVERRWPSMGRVRDALTFLLSSEGLPFPAASPVAGNPNGKREREEEVSLPPGVFQAPVRTSGGNPLQPHSAGGPRRRSSRGRLSKSAKVHAANGHSQPQTPTVLQSQQPPSLQVVPPGTMEQSQSSSGVPMDAGGYYPPRAYHQPKMPPGYSYGQFRVQPAPQTAPASGTSATAAPGPVPPPPFGHAQESYLRRGDGSWSASGPAGATGGEQYGWDSRDWSTAYMHHRPSHAGPVPEGEAPGP